MPKMPEIQDENELLLDTSIGRATSPEELFERVYQDLGQVARSYVRRERPDHTLQATALVNEAYLRLFDGREFQWKNRKHLFCTVARSMRRVLTDHARKRSAARHGGAFQRITLDEQGSGIFQDLPEFLALSEAIDKLAQMNPRQERVVELHALAGLTEEEVAEVLDVSVKTVKNDRRFAKAWLKTEIARYSW